ncbi:MAG: hypothetical protein GX791_00860 [Synergistaceae bacterium]|nr:hypothetical protein [Synergistaceae bacterium]
MKIRLLLRLIILVLVLPWVPLSPAAAALPEIPGFQGEEERIFPLFSAAGSVGQWTLRIYRKENGNRLMVTLLTGPGPGVFSPAKGGEKKDDRPIGFGSTYEIVPLGGRRAVLEEVPSLGFALAVPLEEGSLTLESSSLSREEILSAALPLLHAISIQK